MKKLTRNIAQLINKQFQFFWIICSIILLIICLLTNWYYSQNRSYEALHEVANGLSNNVDDFIDDLFQDIYTLPVYGKELKDCQSGLFPFMEHISLNNPMISGLIISDKDHKLVCSTLPNNEILISANPKTRTISGPFRLGLFDQPVYLIQKKMGHYNIGIIVVSSVLQSVLRVSVTMTDSIALHNEFEKRNIIRVEKDPKKLSWVLSKDIEQRSPLTSQSLFAVEHLQSIDGVIVVVFENHKTQLYNLWYSQLILLLLFIICSYLLYHLIKKIITKRYSLHTAMKSALKNREFYPVYQPLFDINRHTYSGVEVLLRWQDNQDEIIMPDFFITEAERTGLIVPITLQIMETSFQEFEEILKKDPDFHLAFNLSALHFTDPSFFKEYYLLANEYKIMPKQVIFEITERELLDKNIQIFTSRMQELRKAGYSLAVDDYGTGHASISYLQNFPFNYLKIDKLFVQAIGTKAITESLNEAIITMAKQLNLAIIAEGVETKEQFNYLSENGVRFLQGWYFSKALSIEKLTRLLKGTNHDSLH